MRVIAGKYKGKKLKSPSSDKTRPTLDRVKEAIFSMVNEKIEGAEVLDLFGGSGAISVEFLSRGAKYICINDSSKEAISTILYNIKLTNEANCVKITLSDYKKCLKKLNSLDKTFDIIFLDPPYASDDAYETLKYISENKGSLLKEDGIIIYELEKQLLKDKYDEIPNLECFKTRFYGRVAVKLYKWRD